MDVTKEFHTNSEEIDLSNRNLTEIHHLEKFPHLKKLNISNNPVDDFRLLKKLPKLKEVKTNKP